MYMQNQSNNHSWAVSGGEGDITARFFLIDENMHFSLNAFSLRRTVGCDEVNFWWNVEFDAEWFRMQEWWIYARSVLDMRQADKWKEIVAQF